MKRIISIILIGIVIVLYGCSQKDNTPLSPDNSKPVAQEMPEDVQSLVNRFSPSDSALYDPGNPVTAVSSPSLFDTSYDIYSVTFLWGNLLNVTNSAAGSTTDWTGSLSMNAIGAVLPLLPISFEQGQDSLIKQNIPTSVGWVSYTKCDFDGLSCLVFVKRGIYYYAPVWLTFATSPFTVQYDFSELEQLAAYYRIDDNNSVAVYARRISLHHCPEGILVGQWIKTDMTGDSGIFNGQWLDENGDLTGIFAGTFWTTGSGKRVFSGWISHPILTVIIGHMHGVFYYDDPRDCILCGTGFGKFTGLFKYTNQKGVGVIAGEMKEDSTGSLKMSLNGTWRLFCPHSTYENSSAGN
jgi:hypothetical protein